MSFKIDNNRSIDIENNKKKWEITLDYMMIIGKYYDNSLDFINNMKVNSKYKDLALLYHFNPINETSLFENMETQHFYNYSDIINKKDNMFKYIYWFKNKEMEKYKQDNEIFKDINLNYIIYYIPLLEEWSGLNFNQILYDSEIDERTNKSLNHKIFDKNNLYFIVIDSKNNIFGHFHYNYITKYGVNYDSDLFIFSLKTNEKNEIKKFENISKNKTCTEIYSRRYILYCGSWNDDGYKLYDYNNNKSYIGKDISKSFKDSNPFYFTGINSKIDEDGSVLFNLNRLIVIQMN